MLYLQGNIYSNDYRVSWRPEENATIFIKC